MPEESSAAQPLADEILADAERRAKRLRARAETEAKEIAEHAQAEAKEVADAAAEHAQGRVDVDTQRILATINQELRSLDLAARQEAIDKAFAAAREKLAAAPADRDTLVELCGRAIATMDGDRFVISLAARDHALGAEVCKAVAEKLSSEGHAVDVTLDDTPGKIIGGAIVSRADGKIVFDNSFDARLARAHDDLRSQIARILFSS